MYLGVPSELDLKVWTMKIEEKEIPFTIFREPDIGNQITSLAAVTEGKVFSNLKLL